MSSLFTEDTRNKRNKVNVRCVFLLLVVSQLFLGVPALDDRCIDTEPSLPDGDNLLLLVLPNEGLKNIS